MTMYEPVTSEYWHEHHELFTGVLPSYHRTDPVTIWGRVHTQEEHYAFPQSDREIIEVEPRRGTRTYICLQPYYYAPQYVIPIAITPQGIPFAHARTRQPALVGAIGMTTGPAELETLLVERIGNAWAVYYPGVTTWMLWECYVYGHHRTEPYPDDATTHALWTAFEALLVARTPDATRIVTPPRDSIATTKAYQALLVQHGYGPVSDRAWGKDLTPTA
jgi:hypothetical protein